MKLTTRNTLIFALTALAVIAVDQISKALVVAFLEPGRSVTLIPRVISLTHSTNTGAAFGIFRGNSQLALLAAIVIIALTVAWFLAFRRKKGAAAFIGLGLIIGGALGNLIDRVARQKVVDFFDLGFWPVFNIADLAIVAGVIVIVILTALDMRAESAAVNPDGGS